MTLFPEVQKKAQREIDAVIGNDRLPCIADRDELPYVNAVCTEILRWNPTLPLGASFCDSSISKVEMIDTSNSA